MEEVAGAGEIAVDAGVAASGARSLRITQRRADDFVRVAQRVAPPHGTGAARRVRVTAAVRDTGVSAAEAAVWLRVSGRKGVLFADSRGDSRERPPALHAPATAAPVSIATAVDAWTIQQVELPLPDDAEEIAFGAVLRGEGSAWFDDVTFTVAPVEGAAPTASAVRYLDAALALLQANSLNRAAVDWPALRTAALAQARGAVTAADAHPAVRFALRELGDGHSYLLAPGPAAALLAAPVSNARTGRAAVAPAAHLVANRYGFVDVPGFAGGSRLDQVEFAQALQDGIASVDSSWGCGWILDLRRNTGGNLWPMLAGVGPLLGPPLGRRELAASVYPDGSRRPVWYDEGRAGFGDYVQLRVAAPHTLRVPSAPLAVLVGGRTASSAEVLLAALRGRPATRTFGAPTRGLSAGNRTFALADGAGLVLTVAATSDRAGRVDLGPIEPDERIAPATPAAVATHESDAPQAAPALPNDPVLAAAVAWLATQAECR